MSTMKNNNVANGTTAQSPAKLLLKPREAAALLSISERKLWQMTQDGEIQSKRLGRLVRYPLSWLEEWIEDSQADQNMLQTAEDTPDQTQEHPGEP